jgi:hypothetical protein
MGTSTPGSWPPSERAAVRTPARRRYPLLVIAGLVVVLVNVLGVAGGSAGRGGPGSSGVDCVTVGLASSTGGVMRHECGEAARAWCRSAWQGTDRLSELTRVQCRAAGILPPDGSSTPPH